MTTANDVKQNNLSKLRKEKGLSISDVASKLKLTSDVIKKLEKSDFNDLGAYPYIRGYLINYANLLETNPDPFITLIPKDSKTTEIVNTYSKSAKLIKFKRQSKGLGNYAVGTFIVLSVCFSGWYLLKMYSVNSELNSLDANTTLELSPKNSNDIVDVNSTDQNTIISDESESFHYSSLIPANGKPASSESSSSENNTENNDLLFEETDKINDNSVDNSLEVKSKQFTIEVNALETSWIKIENENGEKIFSDLFQPGIKVFESDSPLHFRIGNQSKVEVTINGKAIDISQYSTKNIADFDWPNLN